MLELAKAGFKTTVLTRSAALVTDLPPGVDVKEADYNSKESLIQALKGQDALVSTVAMSAIENQKLMIDAAIEAGVKHFIPAEYTIATRDPKAQWIPIYSSVLDIEHYLMDREKQMDWTVVQCGALIEFSLDYPFVLDFDNATATLWDGGENPLSICTCAIVGKAIASLLKLPEKVQDHVVRVHGGLLTQRQALQMARKYSDREWTVIDRDAEPEILKNMDAIKQGLSGDALLLAFMTIMAAATFGNGHFEARYTKPDNAWLGIDSMPEGEIEEGIRKRIVEGKGSLLPGTAGAETMNDVAEGLRDKHAERG